MNSHSKLLSETIRELEENVNKVNEDMLTVRMDDFKRAVVGEVNTALREHGEQLLRKAPANMDGFAFCTSREQCRQSTEEAVQEALLAFQSQGADAARSKLEETREGLKDVSENCGSKDCNEYLMKVLTEAGSALAMAKRIQSLLGELASPGPPSAEPSSFAMEAMSALSNPHRINLMYFMDGGQRAFSDMTEHCGLKAGHLQFHLRNLMELGLLDKTERRGTYTITAEGAAAMRAMEEFDRRLRVTKGAL